MIDKYKEAFQEEAREILLELESALLELDDRRDDPELVGRAFRALHTIKGSGAMFGFDAIAAFTHHIENAFDLVRNGRMSATSDLISLSLTAVDQIKTMLDEASGRVTADPAAASLILAKLRDLTGTPEAPPVKKATTVEPAAQALAAGIPVGWHVRFAPGADLIRNGTNPLLLLREMRQMGRLQINASPAAIPPLPALDPERCYVAWDMVLITTAGADAIRDVFMFVEDCCELSIEAVTSAPGPKQVAAESAPVPPSPFGGRVVPLSRPLCGAKRGGRDYDRNGR